MKRRKNYRDVGVMALFVATLLGTTLQAQQIFRWVDERGVVHFSQSPPPDVPVEEIEFGPSEPIVSGREAEASEGEEEKEEGAGPKVELVKHEMERTGSFTQRYFGEVKNFGQGSAADVVVVLVVSDSELGECFRTEIEVTPSTLPAGATGTFDAEFENPCFFANTKADLTVQWGE